MGSRKAGEIGDDLLIEILSRIPTPVVAIRCKLVCKHWCSMISSPFFIRRFKQQHMKHPKPLSGILANTAPRLDIGDSDDFNFRGFSLDYLPAKNENMVVVASCNDLIICKERKHDIRDYYSSECDYYLCNPFTMQWAAVPRPPPPPRPRWFRFRTGLVCKPGDRFRCRIVFFYKESDPSRLETLYHLVIYCWETGEWIRYDDRGKEYSVEASTVAAYNGKLHWISRDGEHLVTLDPFDMRRTSLRFINDANNDGSWSVVYYVGECEGVLRVVRLETGRGEGQMTSKGMTVWELQEDEHDRDATRLIFKDHVVLSDLKQFIDRVAFHPRNRDVLFWKSRDSLGSFNTKSRELKVETQFKSGCSFPYLWTLQLPWWPTPIEEAGSSPI